MPPVRDDRRLSSAEVCLNTGATPPHPLDLLFHRVRFRGTTQEIENDIGAGGGQRQRDRATNTAAGASDQSIFPLSTSVMSQPLSHGWQPEPLDAGPATPGDWADRPGSAWICVHPLPYGSTPAARVPHGSAI